MITVRHLSKCYTGTHEPVLALEDVSFDVTDESFFTLLGPSGCGKSTLLRCLAGLETPDSGEITIGGRTVFSSEGGINVPPNRRQIGMVFQSYAIWPHMTVVENVAFPLEVTRQSRIRERAMTALETVGLAALAGRNASRLSGGQQQRVAFARAIVAEPAVLLLDEPLSNLDAGLRDQMRHELQSLQKKLRVTTILVTHDQAEALALSDHIAVMRAGRFVEAGRPEDLYAKPTTCFVAEFLGAANLLPGEIGPPDPASGFTPIHTHMGPLWSTARLAPGAATVAIRPEHLQLTAASKTGLRNAISCRVRSQSYLGQVREIVLAPVNAPEGFVLRARTPGDTPVEAAGMISVTVNPQSVWVIRA